VNHLERELKSEIKMTEKPINRTDEKPNNPKDKMGALKLDPTLIPVTALIGVMECMANGAEKYGPYNWRNPDKKVGVKGYLAGGMRHILSYLDGEECAPDSIFHHIDHAISGLLVLRDAQRNGFAIDDRPAKGRFGELIEEDFQEAKEFNEGKFYKVSSDETSLEPGDWVPIEDIVNVRQHVKYSDPSLDKPRVSGEVSLTGKINKFVEAITPSDKNLGKLYSPKWQVKE
jgi:hypothetical protein